ncbi:hypothetical protein GF325_18775 [Candidatus Bathyarchaeota archaeon]|nr:hypothetical protein [Candidatus Bathyarchaeota archaeon]
MNKIWHDVEVAHFSYHQGHLWLQLEFEGNQEPVDILGIGKFRVNARMNGKLVPVMSFTTSFLKPRRIVLYSRDIPALRTIKLFDKANNLAIHVFTGDQIEIHRR